MKRIFSHPFPTLLAVGCLAAALLLAPAAARAQVELNPGYIQGTVQVGAEPIFAAGLRGTSDTLTARLDEHADPPVASLPYEMTVQVEPGGTRTWEVLALVYMGSVPWTDYTVMETPAFSVEVVDGVPATLDFILPDPCIVQGAITITGGTFSSAVVYAGAPHQSWTANQANADASGAYRLLLWPGYSYELRPYITLGNGATVVPEVVSVECVAGATITQDYPVTAPSATISGHIEFAGPETVSLYRFQGYGPVWINRVLGGPFGPLNDTFYQLTDLLDGSYNIFYQAQLNPLTCFPSWPPEWCTYDDFLEFPGTSFVGFDPDDPACGGYCYPPNSNIEIVEGSTPVLDIADQQAFINGTLTLTGTTGLSDVRDWRVEAQSENGGRSRDGVDLSTGAYDLVVTDNEPWWGVSSHLVSLSRPSDDPRGYLQESLRYSDYSRWTSEATPPFELAAGETLVQDLEVGLGSVTVSFSVSGGSLLSYPNLEAQCFEYNELGELLSTLYISSANWEQFDVEVGQVSIVGMKGTCSVNATAYVDGTYTSFGDPFTVEVIPGVDQQIEIGGPTLLVGFEAGQCLEAEVFEVTVTGLATDDTQVATVTVNGVAAALDSTFNPNDPNEVSFSATVPIDWGLTEIVTIATDTAGKTATDTRPVYKDSGAPVLSFIPANGTGYPASQTSVLVEGTATDDSAIASVTANGIPAVLDGTSFSATAPIEFVSDAATVTVVAADACGNSTTVVHTVVVGGCVDGDGDGYGSPGDASCANGAAADCNDANASVNPGAAEICDGADNNCDGFVDEGFDLDGDGWTTCAGDCDDGDAEINPAATEVCNGVDDNCDGATDEGSPDGDGDEVCDAIDNCPEDANPGQEDCDLDGSGDVCDEDDTDGDGLTDAQEISYAGGVCPGSCPDPVDSDSDDDGLLDGLEYDVDPDKNCDFCAADTDGDGVLDALDPFCNDPTLTGDCALDLAGFETYILSLPTSVFQAPGADTEQQRKQTRAHLASIIGKAAKHFDKCETANSVKELQKALARVDGAEPPLDDMVAGAAEKATVLETIEDFLYLFEIGVCAC